MRTFLPQTFLAILVCLISFQGTAQIRDLERHNDFSPEQWKKSPRFFQRFNVCVYGMNVSGATVDYKYRGRNYYGRMESESFSVKLTAHSSYNCGLGTFFPLTKLGAKSKLALAVDIGLTSTNYNNLDGSDGVNIFGNREEVLVGLDEIIAPITLDYKTGCDAMLSKDLRTCFTIGFGACYQNTSGIFYDIASTNINSISPVFKMEAGVRWGMCFKLRMMYRMGRVTFMNQENNTYESEESMSMYGNGSLMFSLLVMPTAVAWSSTGFK